MGKAFDATGSYQTLLMELAALTAASSALMLLVPRYAGVPGYGAQPDLAESAVG
jgi:hypothetical protein